MGNSIGKLPASSSFWCTTCTLNRRMFFFLIDTNRTIKSSHASYRRAPHFWWYKEEAFRLKLKKFSS